MVAWLYNVLVLEPLPEVDQTPSLAPPPITPASAMLEPAQTAASGPALAVAGLLQSSEGGIDGMISHHVVERVRRYRSYGTTVNDYVKMTKPGSGVMVKLLLSLQLTV